MSIVALDDIKEFVGVWSADEIATLEVIHNATEDWVENYCHRTFTSTTYTLEKYNGNGTRYIYLKNYPITAVQLLSVGTRDAMYIYNTNDYSYASVSVSSTGLTLSRDGSTDSSPTFAVYTTLTTLVAAINAVGSGWVAALSSSAYANFKSSFLLSKWGASTIDSNYVYLQIPEDPEDDFDLDENSGVVRLSWAPPLGFRNIYVTYTAGYSTIPDDLSLAIKILTRDVYNKTTRDSWGIWKYTVGDISFTFGDPMAMFKSGNVEFFSPPEVVNILARYRKRLV